MLKLLRQFMSTISFYCRGKGSPWRLIWLWWFLLNILSFLIGAILLWLTLYLSETQWIITQLFSVIIMVMVGFLGGIITFIYPLIFIYALCKCAFNVRWEPLGFLFIFFIFPFLVVHYFLGTGYFMSAGMMFYGAFDILKKILP